MHQLSWGLVKTILFLFILILSGVCAFFLFAETSAQNSDMVFRAGAVSEYEAVKPILKAKCMNCHSGETQYPSYYKIPYAKQIIDEDIANGQEKMLIDKDLNSMILN